MNKGLKAMRMEAFSSLFEVFNLDKQRKIMKNLKQGSRCVGRDSNQTPRSTGQKQIVTRSVGKLVTRAM
jgi:hypothetical protein